ncbi:PfkB family carbohydrate kinase [Micromonospora sp. NPDC049580]|uniref:PfkB family carbohydrate kinase n=1 Tax=Micromonospora sp. NPDC049580 TaxID=3154832 RepID=UPI0034471115
MGPVGAAADGGVPVEGASEGLCSEDTPSPSFRVPAQPVSASRTVRPAPVRVVRVRGCTGDRTRGARPGFPERAWARGGAGPGGAGGGGGAGPGRAGGAATVVVTLGAAGAVLAAAGADPVRVRAPKVNAIDATGAGDSVMAALIADLLLDGEPDDPAGWVERVAFALRVAGLVCESPGGATAMPTRTDVERRFGS